MSISEYARIKKCIIRSKRYKIIKNHLVTDGRVLTINGFVDYFTWINR